MSTNYLVARQGYLVVRVIGRNFHPVVPSRPLRNPLPPLRLNGLDLRKIKSLTEKVATCGGTSMYKRVLIILVCVFAFSVSGFAKKPKKKVASGAPDKAYLQKLMDGWSSLDPTKMAQYYDQGE